MGNRTDRLLGAVVAAILFFVALFYLWQQSVTNEATPTTKQDAQAADVRQPEASTTAHKVETMPVTQVPDAEAEDSTHENPVAKDTVDPFPPPPEDVPWVRISPSECETLRHNTPLYADPGAQAIKVEQELRDEGRTEEAALLREISCFPHSTWLTGTDAYENTLTKVAETIALSRDAGKLPVFVLYNRATEEYAGWASGFDTDAYLSWVRGIKDTIGDAPAWIILEPDALPTAIEYAPAEQAKRMRELRDAVTILNEGAQTAVYIDAGHSSWLRPEEAATLLQEANIAEARGFSLNVANFRTTEDEIAYGSVIAEQLDGSHFIIDTSRNGSGPHPDAEWCNAPDSALGQRPQVVDGSGVLDALVWVKPPGESDGECNGGPSPGIFWLDYALELVKNSR